MKEFMVAFLLVIVSACSAASAPQAELVLPVRGPVTEIAFRVVTVGTDSPENHIIRQYTTLHSITDTSTGIGFRITSHGHPFRIDAFFYDTKTGEPVLRREYVDYILTNIHSLLLSGGPLSVGDVYVFSFQHCDGYQCLVDVKKKSSNKAL